MIAPLLGDPKFFTGVPRFQVGRVQPPALPDPPCPRRGGLVSRTELQTPPRWGRGSDPPPSESDGAVG